MVGNINTLPAPYNSLVGSKNPLPAPYKLVGNINPLPAPYNSLVGNINTLPTLQIGGQQKHATHPTNWWAA
ncbi:MAG TPA: hypothetical protein ENF37_03285 [Beggiatoa sp.]|nr:hypothetical protein [Beggiatoa sp.]